MTDLAEFLGGAVGLNLLFGIPLFPAALLTGAIISVILYFERYGLRKVELVVLALIAVIGLGYMIEMFLVKPPAGAILHGLLVPTLPAGAILVAVGIVGATVMPHNLYLHSALIQSRFRPGDSLQRKRGVSICHRRSVVALNAALLVSCAILISGQRILRWPAHRLFSRICAPDPDTVVRAAAGAVFAITLLASGLSSSTLRRWPGR
jgi:manganese transport protein